MGDREKDEEPFLRPEEFARSGNKRRPIPVQIGASKKGEHSRYRMNWVQISFMVIGFILGATLLKGALPFALRFGLKVRFWLRHGRKGKIILFVYSDSSNWKNYIETNILPRIEAHSIILNWSKRREWASQMQLETKLFNQWAGPGEFVPVAILFSLTGKVRTFRLWQPSGNPKRGKEKISKGAEQALVEAVKQFER